MEKIDIIKIGLVSIIAVVIMFFATGCEKIDDLIDVTIDFRAHCADCKVTYFDGKTEESVQVNAHITKEWGSGGITPTKGHVYWMKSNDNSKLEIRKSGLIVSSGTDSISYVYK